MTAPLQVPAVLAQPPQRRGHRRLVLRIYALCLGSVVLSGLTIAAVVKYGLEQPWKTEVKPMTGYLVANIAAETTTEAMAREATRIRSELDADVTVYDQAGQRVVSTAEPPLRALLAAERGRLDKERVISFGSPQRVAVAITTGRAAGGYALLAPPPPSISLREAGLVTGLILACFALTSVFFARLLSLPLAELGRAARAFGKGDLHARVGLDRRDEFGELAQAFNDMADHLTHLLRSQKELLANISHELRTPLHRIRFALELLTDGDQESASRFMGEITRDLGELEQLVGDVLTTARLELDTGLLGESHTPLRLEPLSPDALIEEAAKRFRSTHGDHRLALTVPKLLPPVDGDAKLLRRAIDNLLDNAGKYSDSNREVTLRARDEKGRLVVEIRDEGIGIEPRDMPKIFHPFFRTDRSRARATGGIGLGLPLVKRIIEAHGGEIEIQSQVGAGTLVRFWIPGLLEEQYREPSVENQI